MIWSVKKADIPTGLFHFIRRSNSSTIWASSSSYSFRPQERVVTFCGLWRQPVPVSLGPTIGPRPGRRILENLPRQFPQSHLYYSAHVGMWSRPALSLHFLKAHLALWRSKWAGLLLNHIRNLTTPNNFTFFSFFFTRPHKRREKFELIIFAL